jgi:hypothetical protein
VSALKDPSLSLADSPLLALLAESALAVERLAAGQGRRSSAQMPSTRLALLAIELRLKLEEQVLLPRFRQLGLPTVATVENQIEMLRELLAEARWDKLPVQSSRLPWASIERMSALHFDAVAQLMLLALANPEFNADQAWRDAEEYRSRWRNEIAETGDIEDEEADPVGEPPR